MERLPTRLDGLVLLAPAVHGDAWGFFMLVCSERDAHAPRLSDVADSLPFHV